MPRKVVKRSKPKTRKIVRNRYESTLDVLSKKLNPNRFTAMSPKMAAIVAYIIGERYTCPHIESMIKTSDGMVIARQSGDIGYNIFIGHISEVDSNWKNLINAADLTSEEEKEAMRLYERMIQRGFPTS